MPMYVQRYPQARLTLHVKLLQDLIGTLEHVGHLAKHQSSAENQQCAFIYRTSRTLLACPCAFIRSLWLVLGS